VFVAGAGVVCAAGRNWRGLAGAAPVDRPGALPPVPRDCDPCEPRRLNLMSRGAHLGAIALHAALADAGWAGAGADVGLFMGVGASGGDLAELEAMLRPALRADGGGIDLARFGAQGLAAANPMFAFQLMNNFTLCHGAIAAGLQGPSSAFHSRGAGTVTALREAAFAIAEGDVGRTCAGGADSALHPVTLAELDRAGARDRGCIPGEGAALLALAAECARPLARLARAQVFPGGELQAVAARALPRRGSTALVLAACSDPARAALLAAADGWPGPVLDVAAATGEALAATPAIAWTLALDRLVRAGDTRVVVLSAGPDGDLGVVELQQPRGDV
jgi:hypothetical protein